MTMKLVCPIVTASGEVTKVLTTVSNDPAILSGNVMQRPGVGKPYWMWPTLPAGTLIAADFTDAPVVDASRPVNEQRIRALLDAPPLQQDVLTWAT